ncbi:hypothetical protein [Candidatus Methylacidithermus pantelleriae]|uniref:Uncharacterized protein n=1 Tax=Candidatus Methylacidithermus pantelleriae TaxID=2744239 RepID=A0A8J2FRM4_9BACT|nr:hypothetical protein [Candidatus Methylacidithermus pantelleriae]CAF0689456.1 hypothetical protein MPNT_10228 [Candidatus Methylacidithermus pantelleriae]
MAIALAYGKEKRTSERRGDPLTQLEPSSCKDPIVRWEAFGAIRRKARAISLHASAGRATRPG